MKFTAFVLATAAASAAAQMQLAFNPFMQQQNQFVGGVNFAPYQLQNPYQFNQPFIGQPYQFAQPVQQVQQVQQQQDPLAWERDCTWINSINFRAALSVATCGSNVCTTAIQPNGNGGGSDRKLLSRRADRTAGEPNGAEYHVWGSVINRAGRVCAVAYTGPSLDQQFPYGRIQSMKRANTANSLSLPSRAMPSHVADRHNFIESQLATLGDGTANNLPVSPGRADNAWYGFSHDRFNPGNIDVQFQGAVSNYGEACGQTRQDPMCMQKPGGMDFSAGGLPLYDQNAVLRGAIGVAGDNDCTSHAIAWKARQQLNMDWTPVNVQRSTFNTHVMCTALGALPALPAAGPAAGASIFKEEVRELCDPTFLEPVLYTPLVASAPAQTVRVKYATWGHTGGFGEDNVFFSNNESRNFPACYDLVRRFPIDNPTRSPAGTAKAY
jgi:hypothetical protein